MMKKRNQAFARRYNADQKMSKDYTTVSLILRRKKGSWLLRLHFKAYKNLGHDK